MKNFKIFCLVYSICILSFATLNAQENIVTFDMSEEANEFMTERSEGFSVGNAWNEPRFDVFIFEGHDFNGQTLEIMNSKVTVFGEYHNLGEVILTYPGVSEIHFEDQSLSIEEEDIRTYAIFPNPAVNHVMINAKVDGMIMYDLNGRLIAQSDSNTMRFNTADGVYVVLIRKGVKMYSKKLIVKR